MDGGGFTGAVEARGRHGGRDGARPLFLAWCGMLGAFFRRVSDRMPGAEGLRRRAGAVNPLRPWAHDAVWEFGSRSHFGHRSNSCRGDGGSRQPVNKEDPTMTPNNIHIGVDVSKEKLDVFAPDAKRVVSVSNGKTGIRRIVELARRNGWSVCCEATGVYTSALIDGCHDAGVPVAVANPFRVRRYAQGRGILEKTDEIDARVIARYADENQPRPTPKPTPDERLLRELTDGREFYIRQIQEVSGRIEQCPRGSAIRKLLEQTLRQHRKALAELDGRRARLAAASAELSRRRDRFMRVQGIGETVALNVMAAMPELGRLSDKEA